MDLQAELKWIHQELDEVKDETLLEAIKNILKYRKKVAQSEVTLSEEQYQIIDKRREAHLKGESKSFTWEQVKQNARNAV
jgi:Asp-tRNA(Asn)/Glu-tRNA(Gln) amidotransferase C subunit